MKLGLFININSVTILEDDTMSSYNASTDYLKSYGINNPKAIYLNMPTEALYEEALQLDTSLRQPSRPTHGTDQSPDP